MNDEQMAAAFNEWMRQYVEDPDKFAQLRQSVKDFLAASGDGREPTYGDKGRAMLWLCHQQLNPDGADNAMPPASPGPSHVAPT